MKGIWFPVMFVTAFLAVYVVLSLLSFDRTVTAMFFISPFLVVWMVLRVLKDGKPSGRTFSEYFYDDLDYRRLPDEN
jgi:Flp pilus assembly protein TadB